MFMVKIWISFFLCKFPGVNAYCISKSAIDQMTRCTALELAPKQVRVNAVNPGVIKTDVHLRSGMTPEAYAEVTIFFL